MIEKKSPELLRYERTGLKIRKNQQWLHKKSGRVCKIVDIVCECNTNMWYITYEFVAADRFDPHGSEPCVGIVFCRVYGEFVEKFEPLIDTNLLLTKAEIEMLNKKEPM